MRAAQQSVRDAERRFPVRIRIGIPPEGLGGRLDKIIEGLDANCGSDGWISMPSSTRGVVNDALAIYFADADPATLHALALSAIEHAIQEWVSSGVIAHWINWHALKSADEKTEVLD